MSDFFDEGPVQPSTLGVDHDGDGFAETTYVDTDGDGRIDTVIEYDPYTGATAVAADTDGDGLIDVVAVDWDGDGIIDDAITDGTTVDPTAVTEDGPHPGPFETSSTEGFETIPADDPDPDSGIHGEPRADIEYHQVQPGPVDCLPTSVAMALTEMTGELVPASELVEMANEHGFMFTDGMAPADAVTLFENYGMEAEVSSGTLDDLREALAAGDPIIVGIDAADVYYGGGGPFDPGMESGHAVIITGIDDGPPGSVYINDPGFPDGAGVEIPLELFEDAWEDSENTMVVAQAPDTDTDTDTGAVTDGTAEPEGAFERLILLPLNFILAD